MSDVVPIPIDRWAAELQRTINDSGGFFRRVVALDETESTQDAARRIDAQIGDVILAGRQTAGRGRLGRTWADTGEHGVAMTVVMTADRPERMAIASAVAVACALEVVTKVRNGLKPLAVGIKWPNDIIVRGRKIAGILIQQDADRALIGIGINVGQTTWPDSLANRAISLAQVELPTERVEVIDYVLQFLIGSSRQSDAWLIEQFQRMDVLQDSVAAFRSADIEVQGTVQRIDPMNGLAVLTGEGEVWLPAATTTVLDWHFPVHSD